MKITVAGEDVTKDAVPNLQAIAVSRETEVNKEPPEALKMAEAKTETEYSERHIEQLRTRCGVDTESIDVGGSGFVRSIRKALWKLMRPVFDLLFHRQSVINEQTVHAMEMEKRERDRQISELRREIEELRKKA